MAASQTASHHPGRMPTYFSGPLSRRVVALSRDQGGVVSRRQLYEMGVTRWMVIAHLRAKRWRRIGDQSVAVHTGPLAREGHWWAAVFQGGPRAQLDGASALEAAGLERFSAPRVRVSVPRGARTRRSRRYDVRQTRRWSPEDSVSGSGVPRTRPPVAAVRGALWAATDRQATYLVTLAVQQGIVRPEDVGLELLRVKRDKRRLLLTLVVNDLLGGARSLGELDVARELRRRGLPEPDRQVLRKDKKNRYYLDLYWDDFGLVVEIDGIHHAWVQNVVGDALRQNSLVIAGDVVLRLPLLGLRLQPDDFFDQIREALVTLGWSAAA